MDQMPDSGPPLPKRNLLRTMSRRANAVLAKAAKAKKKLDEISLQHGKLSLIKSYKAAVAGTARYLAKYAMTSHLRKHYERSLQQYERKLTMLANDDPDSWTDPDKLDVIIKGEGILAWKKKKKNYMGFTDD